MTAPFGTVILAEGLTVTPSSSRSVPIPCLHKMCSSYVCNLSLFESIFYTNDFTQLTGTNPTSKESLMYSFDRLKTEINICQMNYKFPYSRELYEIVFRNGEMHLSGQKQDKVFYLLLSVLYSFYYCTYESFKKDDK